MTPSQIKLIGILEELLNPAAPISLEQTLGELGADSLDIVELAIAIEEDFSRCLDSEQADEEINTEKSVEQIAHWLDSLENAPLTTIPASSY